MVRIREVWRRRQCSLSLDASAFIISALPKCGSEARTSLRISSIERDRPSRQCLDRTQRFEEAVPLKGNLFDLNPD